MIRDYVEAFPEKPSPREGFVVILHTVDINDKHGNQIATLYRNDNFGNRSWSGVVGNHDPYEKGHYNRLRFFSLQEALDFFEIQANRCTSLRKEDIVYTERWSEVKSW